MSTSRSLRLSRKRKRELCSEDTHDICDDFQEFSTIFRIPKRLLSSKSQGKSKRSVLDQDTQEVSQSTKKHQSDEHITMTLQQDQHLEEPGNEILTEDASLQKIENLLCSDSEKLCPSCKIIIPIGVFADHFKECLQKFKLTKRGEKFHVDSKGEEVNEQEELQSVLPCPVCKKPFECKTQRVSHVKACAQSHGLTSEQLLLASRLLEKQTEEWNELGLSTVLQLHNTRAKVHRNVKHSRVKDPDLAMALALSRSIAEEELESRSSREEKLLALRMEEIVNEDRKLKPVLLPPPQPVNSNGSAKHMRKGAKNRKGSFQPLKTPLVTRSVEERERLISERVAVLLTTGETTKVGWTNYVTPKHSKSLACLVNEPCQLWEASRSGTDEPLHRFYVPELEPYINPKETVIGSLLKQLSQIPGRLNTTAMHALDEESESECEMETTEVEEFCTQMALAELMDSSEEQESTSEIEWEQTAEMNTQGFLLPSQTAKGENKFRQNENNGVDIQEVLEKRSDDHIPECKHEENTVEVEEDSEAKNKIAVSWSEEESLHNCKEENKNVATHQYRKQSNLHHISVPHISDDTHDSGCETSDSKFEYIRSSRNKSKANSQESTVLQDVCILSNIVTQSITTSDGENGKHNPSFVPPRKFKSAQIPAVDSCNLDIEKYAENLCFDSDIESQKHEQSTDTAKGFAGCNTSSVHSISNIPLADSDTCSKYDGDEDQLEGSPLHSSHCEDVYASPLKTCHLKYEEKRGLKVSWMGLDSCRNKSVHQTEVQNTRNYSEASKLPVLKTLISTSEDKTLSKDNTPCTESGLMVDTLIKNWRSILQSGNESDITIRTSDSSFLAVHSLVLLVRCPQLYEESKVTGGIIRWDNIPQKTAQHFLSYLYTGTCEVTTPGDPLWMELYDVALQYNCSDLISYMEFLYKAKSTPEKIPNMNFKKSLEPTKNLVDSSSAVPLGTEESKQAISSLKTPIINLEEDIVLRNSPSNSISDSNKSLMECEKILKPTRLFSEKAPGKLDKRNSPENKASWVNSSVTHKGQDEDELQWDTGAQSPDLFDESMGHRSYIAPYQKTPLLRDTSEHSSCVGFVQVIPEEKGKIFHVPDTSSPCRIALSVEKKEGNKILIENLPEEEKIKSPLLLPDGCEPDEGDDKSDSDVIVLQHSDSETNITHFQSIENHQTKTLHRDSKYSDSEAGVAGHSSVGGHQTEDSIKRMGCADYENEEPDICESVGTDEHYISNIWDDFDTGNSPMIIPEECAAPFLSSSFTQKNNSDDKPGLCVVPTTRSSSHYVASTPLLHHDSLQRKMCSGMLPSSEPEENKSLKLEAKSSVSPEVQSPESAVGLPSDETLVNMAAEIDQWDDDLHQTGNETRSKSSSSVNASSSTPAAPHRMCTSKNTLVTPQPDYKNMTSPELKKELQRYGICALKRKKAVMVLQHVYEQTHPLVTDSEAESSFSQTPQRNADTPKLSLPQMKRTRRNDLASEKQNLNKKISSGKEAMKKSVADLEESENESEEGLLSSSLSSNSSEGSNGYLFGETVLPVEEENCFSSTQQAELASQVRELITNDVDMHRKILMYEPIFVEDLHAMLKSNKTRCSIQALLEVVDDLCITVRTQANQNRHQTRVSKKRKRKSTSPRKNTRKKAS